MSTTLPKSWINAKLDEISSDVTYGYTAKSSSENVGPKLLRITDIQGKGVDWNTVPSCAIDEEKKEKYLLTSGDLVFARTGATVRKSFLIKGDIPESVYASYLIRVRCIVDGAVEYLTHYFQSSNYWNQITEFSSGIGQPNVNGTKLKGLKIPLAPAAEQTRIAQKLDQLLAQVDTVKARVDAIPTIFKRFRQSVLHFAISGKLTEEWRGKVDQYKSIDLSLGELKSELIHLAKTPVQAVKIQQRYSEIENPISVDFDIPEVWGMCNLAKVCEPFSYGTSTKSHVDGDVPVLRMGNLQAGEIDWTHLVYTSNKDEIEKYTLEKNDVLFNRTNSPELVGKTSIYRAERKSIYAGYLIRARCLRLLEPNFLNFLLNSIYGRNYCWAVKSDGVSQSNINAQKLGSFVVPLPSIEEQKEIVRRIEQLFTFADQVEAKVTNAQKQINHLTQSILAKAFRGELVPQDPNDEPASALLDRIKSARAEENPKNKTKRKKKATR